MPPLRIFVAGLAHETNSFSPLPTGMRSFAEDICYRPPAATHREEALGFIGYGDAIAVARAAGDTVIEGPCFWTQPSGPMSAALHAELTGAILDALDAAGPIDAVILNLHGAMMAEGCDDAEGDLLARVRARVGPHLPVGALLDLHGNLTAAMVESGAILVGVKEYPHTDYRERAVELHALLTEMVRGGVRFATTVRTIPLLSLQGTTEAPMRALVRRLGEIERQDGIRSVTVMHGFPWSDMPNTGAAVLVVSDEGCDVTPIAEALAEDYRCVVTSAPVTRVGVEEAIDQALSITTGTGPVVIADTSDNPGGGAACDSTFLLRALIGRDCLNAALGMIWDPQAARIAADAGVGARLRMRLGGKVGPLSGDPLDVLAEVTAVRDDARQRFFSDRPNSPLGLAVALRIGGVDVVVNTIRQQVFSPECFTELGIALSNKGIAVVKSSEHFRAAFDPVARATLYCDAPGSLSTDFPQFPYARLPLNAGQTGVTVDRSPMTLRWPPSRPTIQPQTRAGTSS